MYTVYLYLYKYMVLAHPMYLLYVCMFVTAEVDSTVLRYQD